jgi:glycosyltransferase involved in cell wall biosynthesis
VEISVVIPCLNRERFLDDAIRSALAQGEGVEVIVVDDGSTDGSLDRIRAYGDRVLMLEGPGRGPSAARNAGLAAARGRYVHFLDSDDRLVAGALPKMLEAAGTLGPGRIVVGDSLNIDERGKRIGGPARGYAALTPPGEIPRPMILSRPMSTPLPLFPANALRRVAGFDERLRHFEDRELTIRLLAAGHSFVRVPVAICEVRDHSDHRLSAHAGSDKFDHMAAALFAMKDHLIKDARFVASGEERRAFGRLCWSAARDAARARCTDQAARLFDLATSVAGADARNAPWPLRLLYRALPPYQVERLAEAAKSVRP